MRTEPEPLLVGAVESARIVGVSLRTWRGLNAMGRCPAPLRLGRRVLWSTEELRDWIRAGAPPLWRWDVMRSTWELRSAWEGRS